MRREKKYLLLAAAGILLLSGCKKDQKNTLAMITDGSSFNERSLDSITWEGIERYAKKNDISAVYYEPEQQSRTAYEKAISQAIEDGAHVIVCTGAEFETAVYDMQKQDLSVKYIVLDGVPHAQGSEKEKLRGNTHAVSFSESQAGFLAGYSAVMEGYTGLGFLGGEKTEASACYVSGYVQGANAAAKEKQLASDEVQIRYAYLGSNLLSPEVETKAKDWYQDGCQVIFGCDASILNGIGKAASDTNKRVIGLDTSLLDFEGQVLTKVTFAYDQAVYRILESIRSNTYKGGEKEISGIGSGEIGLDFDASAFEQFTREQYTAICDKIKKGTVEVVEEDVTADPAKYKIDHVTILNEDLK